MARRHALWLPALILLAADLPLHAQTSFPCPDALDYLGFDDGSAERVWKVANPSGPSEWFNVDFDTTLAIRTLVAVAPAFDESNQNKSPTFARVGIYPDNLTVSSLGRTPDLSAPLAEVVGGSVILNNNCNFNPFTIPTLQLGAGTNTHIAFQHTAGDSSMWLCSDTNSSPAGRSYFSSSGYASPASSFTLNWLLRAGAVPAGVSAGTFLINASTAVTVNHREAVALSFYGSAPGQPTVLFTAPPLPIGKILSLPTSSSPVPGAWTICGRISCTVPAGLSIPLNVFWLDTTTTKPNGKNPILKSNTASVMVDPCSSCGSFCFGQPGSDVFGAAFVFRVSQPSGSNDWFNVRHGTPDAASGVTTLTGVEVATWDLCGTGGSGSWAEVGIYPANLTVTSAGAIPDINNPLATVGGASAPVAPGTVDWGFPATLFDTPDVLANTTTIYHTAIRWNTGDSCLWQIADSGSNPCNVLPNSSSFSSPDGYTATVGFASSTNWMQKLDWQ